jgi:prenyltransferase beta subunit
LIQGKLGRRVHNFFAVVFLTQVYGMRTLNFGQQTNQEMRDTIEKLTDFIAKTQEPDGSWHKETFGSLKATGMAWLALRSAASTGIPIRHAALDKTLKFIKGQYNSSTKCYDGAHRGGSYGYDTLYATATAVRVLEGTGCGQETQTQNAIDTFIQRIKSGDWSHMYLTVEGEDYLAAAMMSHALVHREDERWQTWFEFIRGALCKRQNGDGSWVSTACITGRVFATACALLALETPQRLIPMQQ